MSGTGYAQVYMEGRVQSLHRWILGLPLRDPRVADHINRDVLDNRRINLRAVTPSGSNMNRVVRLSPLGRGVKRQRSGRYAARVQRSRATFNLGTYDTAVLAAEAVALFEAGEFSQDRAALFRRTADHSHAPEARRKCPRCR
jgi:hypothetical protein